MADIDYSKYRMRPDSMVLCAYCGKVLKSGKIGLPVSHGVCEKCKDKLVKDYERETGEVMNNDRQSEG